MSIINKRYIEKVAQILRDARLDAFFIAPSEDLKFLTGFSPLYCERMQGLIIRENEEMFYLCNALSAEEAREALPGLDVLTWHDNEGYHPLFTQLLVEKKLGGGKIAVNFTTRAFDTAELSAHHPLRFVNGKLMLEDTRARKTKVEMDCLRKASAILDQALLRILPVIRLGMLEKELLPLLEREIRAAGAEPGGGGVPEDYVGIICAGPNGALPHYHKGTRPLQKGDAVIIDFNCSYKGLGSDMTRTVFLGEMSEQQKQIYDIVLRANLAGEAAAVCGSWVPDVDKAARDIIEEAGFGEYFPYRLGHGIGYMLHESPDIKKSNPIHLEKGMAFSIEPGIYLPGAFGIRIEDVVLINEAGETEVLNQVTKEPIILPL